MLGNKTSHLISKLLTQCFKKMNQTNRLFKKWLNDCYLFSIKKQISEQSETFGFLFNVYKISFVVYLLGFFVESKKWLLT